MATVNIPAAMRKLTEGEPRVSVPGGTLGEVVESLEAAYPGLRERLVENGRVRRGLAAFINDQSPSAGLSTKVAPEDEIYFAPAIAGGV